MIRPLKITEWSTLQLLSDPTTKNKPFFAASLKFPQAIKYAKLTLSLHWHFSKCILCAKKRMSSYLLFFARNTFKRLFKNLKVTVSNKFWGWKVGFICLKGWGGLWPPFLSIIVLFLPFYYEVSVRVHWKTVGNLKRTVQTCISNWHCTMYM